MTTLGTVFLPQLPPERLLAVGRAADEAGLEQLWLWEDCFRESGIASAAAVLGATRELSVGIGVMPVPLRNPALTAMEIATLERIFPGRLVPGIGHGVQSWMQQVGARVSSPLTLLREQYEAISGLLRGETVTCEGRYVRLDAVALDWPPASPPRLLAAASGPKTLRLTGAIADGTVLTSGSTPADVRAARATTDAARADAGGRGRHEIVVYLLTATGDGAAHRIDRARAAAGLDAGQDNAAVGDAEQVAGAVARWTAAGADSVILQPTDDDPDPEGFVRFVAERVRPLVP